MRRQDKVFACDRCRKVFEDRPFDTLSGGGVTILQNARTLCNLCAAAEAINLMQHMSPSKVAPGEAQG